MTNEQLREHGEQLARQICVGIMSGVAAGATEFAAQMEEIARDSEQRSKQKTTDRVLQLADAIDSERERLREQAESATGLRLAGIRRRLAELDALEREAERRLDLGEAPATGELPAPEGFPHARGGEVVVKEHTRKKPAKS